MAHTKSIKKIVIPTDLSNLSGAAISYVRSIDFLANASVYILYVVESTPLVTFPPVEYTNEKLMREVEETVDRDVAEFFRSSVPMEMNATAVVRRGDPCREIARFVEEENADLIVMATHGRTGLSHMLMGSVAEKIIRHATVPVLTIKPAEMRPGFLGASDVEEQLHIFDSENNSTEETGIRG